ncbi:MAG: UDP-3-O-(3-hydroxymyristoyl)glucosamine N-acyltransferase [Planctomycetaceae bacterium]|nr:MAG: UDP-3-O-(3-hydroxymyristoyl)glucosamine N-acyltransferase [Planctomycetaceae bacterium]
MRNIPITVEQIAVVVGGTVVGDGSRVIRGMASMDDAGAEHVTYAVDDRRAVQLEHSKAGAAIVCNTTESAAMPLIRVANVNAAVAKLLAHLSEAEDLPTGKHPSAVIAASASLDADVAVGPNVAVGENVRIGAGSVLCANVSVGANVVIGAGAVLFEGVVVKAGSVIGDRVRIGPNSVIGWDGFGYYFADGVHHKLIHIGNVVIEDDVEIGACTCIDKAKFGSTVVGAGSKLDNLVQIGHNVHIARGCILCGQSGIAGSTTIGNYVVIGGNAGVRDNIKLGDGVQCSAFAAVAQDVEAGQIVAGIPAGPAREQYRTLQALTKLPDLLKRVKELESRLNSLESPKDH